MVDVLRGRQGWQYPMLIFSRGVNTCVYIPKMVYLIMDFTVRLLAPAYDFIESLPAKMQSKVYRTIDLLREFGYRLPEPYSKSLTGTPGLKELRVKLATDICRLFYFHHKGKVYIVTSGYVKKRDKTDPKEILRALRLRDEVVREDE
jgi:phage-related protein